MEPSLRKEFLKGAAKNESKAVSAFVSANSENALKTKPKVRLRSLRVIRSDYWPFPPSLPSSYLRHRLPTLFNQCMMVDDHHARANIVQIASLAA